jgi:hypothetical protein
MSDQPTQRLRAYILQLDSETRESVNETLKRLPALVANPNAPRLIAEAAVRGAVLQNFDTELLERELTLTAEEASQVQAAAMFFYGLAAEDQSIDNIVRATIDSGVLAEESSESAKEVLAEILKSDAVTKLPELRLANLVLPTFQRLMSTIDVRLSFNKDTVRLATPVLVCGLLTDADEERVWFQMNRDQLRSVLEQLQKRLDQMEVASHWIGERTGAPK